MFATCRCVGSASSVYLILTVPVTHPLSHDILRRRHCVRLLALTTLVNIRSSRVVIPLKTAISPGSVARSPSGILLSIISVARISRGIRLISVVGFARTSISRLLSFYLDLLAGLLPGMVLDRRRLEVLIC